MMETAVELFGGRRLHFAGQEVVRTQQMCQRNPAQPAAGMPEKFASCE